MFGQVAVIIITGLHIHKGKIFKIRQKYKYSKFRKTHHLCQVT